MALTEQRIKQIVDVRGRLSGAVGELEWAYRGLYYGNPEAPSLGDAARRAERAARALLDLIPLLEGDAGR